MTLYKMEAVRGEKKKSVARRLGSEKSLIRRRGELFFNN